MKVELAELRGEQFVDFHPDWGSRDLVDAALATAQVDRRVALEVTDVHSLLYREVNDNPNDDFRHTHGHHTPEVGP